jgi:DNA transformation protein
MGEPGVKAGQDPAETSERVVQDLVPLGDVSSRKMFGGYGIFESSAMFALVNSQGELFLKVDDSNRARFDDAGAKQHGKMPYFQVPSDVMEDSDALRDWAGVSLVIAHAAKKK